MNSVGPPSQEALLRGFFLIFRLELICLNCFTLNSSRGSLALKYSSLFKNISLDFLSILLVP